MTHFIYLRTAPCRESESRAAYEKFLHSLPCQRRTVTVPCAGTFQTQTKSALHRARAVLWLCSTLRALVKTLIAGFPVVRVPKLWWQKFGVRVNINEFSARTIGLDATNFFLVSILIRLKPNFDVFPTLLFRNSYPSPLDFKLGYKAAKLAYHTCCPQMQSRWYSV